MTYQMARPISEEAVQAIMGQRVHWQFSQNSHSFAVSNGSLGDADPLPVSVTISSFPYAEYLNDVIVATSDNEFLDSMMVALDGISTILERMEFEQLYNEWVKTRRASSIAGDITRNPAYFRIVGMGPKALPFILEHLREETTRGMPDHWFPALWAISGGENPVPDEDRGRIRKMADAWLTWGRQRGYLDAEGLGSLLSQPQR